VAETTTPRTRVSSSGKVWTEGQCGRCGGHGVVSVYTMGDFDGAGWCPDCGGSGSLWRSPKGALAVYPGGPFCG